MANLASVLNIRDKPSEALKLLRSAEVLLRSAADVEPAQRVTLHFNIARSHALLREWMPAEQRYQKGFRVLEAQNALQSVRANEGVLGLAYVYGKTGRVAEARALYEKGLQYFRKLVGPNHPTLQRWERELRELPAR